MPTVTLNDFKAVLGNVNDGNVVFVRDEQGVEQGIAKANYGSAIGRMFHNYRTAVNNPEENRKIRHLLMAAISNSEEGKALTAEQLARIRTGLGIGREPDESLALGRDELKLALDMLEAMQHTDAIPEIQDDGTVTIPERVFKNEPNRAKNAPDFGNRMVARQYNLFVAKGYEEPFVKEAFNATINSIRESRTCSSPEKMIASLPKTFHGHSRDAVAKFIRQNYALVQSALIDNAVWKYIAAAEKRPANQTQIQVNTKMKDLLFETLTNLMETYGAKKEPVPRIVTLLTTFPAEVAEPDNEAEKQVFDQFKADMTAKLCTLVPKANSAQVAPQQIVRFRRHLLSDVLSTYKAAYEAANGTAVECAAAADAAVVAKFPFLKRYTVDEFKALAANGTLATLFAKTVSGAIDQMKTEDGVPKIADIEAAFKAACDAVEPMMSIEPLAEAYVASLGLDDAQTAEAKKALLDSLEGDPNQKALAASLRAKLIAAVSDDADSVKRTAATLVTTSEAFRAFAEEKTSAFVSPEKILEQRNAIFKACAHARTNEDDKRTWIQRLSTEYESIKAEKEIAWERDHVSEKQRQADRAFLAKYKNMLDDDIFFGKLAILEALQRIPDDSEIHQRFLPGGKITRDVTQYDDFKRVVDEMINEIPLKDLKGYAKYIALELTDFDMYVGMYAKGSDKRPFLNLVTDGSIDFDGLSPKASRFLLDNVYAAMMKQESGMDMSHSMQPYSVPDEVLPILYREVHDSVEKLSAKLSRQNRDIILAERHCAPAEMPADFRGVHLLAQPSDRIPVGFRAQDLFSMSGFGTTDLGKILHTLTGLGIKLNELDRPENWMKMFYLQILVRANGGHFDGTIEWAERQTGKDFNSLTLADCEALFSATVRKETPIDPLAKLSGNRKTVADFLGGLLKTDEANLVAAEMPGLLDALRTLDGGTKAETTVTLFGEQVTIRRRPNGDLTAKFASGDKLSLTVSRSADALISQIENEMTTHVSRYGAENVKAILPKVPGAEDPIARPRELYAKVLSSTLGLPAVNFSHLATKDLQAAAIESLANPQAVKARFATPPKTYNSAEAVEVQERYLLADGVERSLVKMPDVPKVRTQQEREANLPDAATVRDLAADLFMNADTWAYDSGSRVPGQRLESLVKAYAPELKHLGEHPELLQELSPVVRDLVSTLLNELKSVDLNAPNVRDQFAAIEKKIDDATNVAMQAMQAKATALFTGRALEQRETWKQSLGELAGSSGGIDINTPEGRFLKKVLDSYFTQCDPIEKRAMLSALVRHTDGASSDGRQVAEMLKGAGPLLQKMLQKLSPEMFDEETRIAIQDMKSKLAPIPDSVIQAQLLELVRSSHRQILSVEVKKSIGQASVGQALLCRIRTKEHPVSGEDVVIKLLRPNVQTAIQREHELMMRLARELDAQYHTGTSQQETFAGRYASILQEFDFTLEAENIDLGIRAYENPTVTRSQGGNRSTETYDHIHSMNRQPTVDPRTGMLVLEKVDGEPVDRYLEGVKAEVTKALAPITKVTALPGEPTVTTYEATTQKDLITARFQLRFQRNRLVNQRKSVEQLLDAWFERALFGDGMFHNDLHPGNVMLKGSDVTVIDFGNVMRLKKQEQVELVIVFLSALRGNVGEFLKSINSLLDDRGKAVLKALPPEFKTNLETIFKKGTSKNVLPRTLAAMALLQKNGVPIPEAVHNFAQSLERIHGVISAFDAEIRDLERLSGETKFLQTYADSFSANQAEKGGLDVKVDALEKMDKIFVMQGDPVEGLDLNKIETEAKSFKASFEGDFAEGDFETGGEGFGSGVVPFCKEMREKVFTAPDGGVAYIQTFAARYAGMVQPLIRKVNGEDQLDFHSVTGDSEFRAALAAYASAMSAKVRDEAAIAKAQKELLRTMLVFFHGFGDAQARWTHRPVSCVPPVELRTFEESVSASLSVRPNELADVMRQHLGIEKKRFEEVMELANSGAGKLTIMKKAGGDIMNFLSLQGLSDELEKLTDEAEAHAKSVTAATAAADKWNDSLAPNERLSATLRQKLAESARAVRAPKDWEPSLANDDGKKVLRDVLSIALESVRQAIAPSPLTDNAIKYFARIYAATSSKTKLAETLKSPATAASVDAWIAGLQLEADQNVPGSDPQLITFVNALRNDEFPQ